MAAKLRYPSTSLDLAWFHFQIKEQRRRLRLLDYFSDLNLVIKTNFQGRISSPIRWLKVGVYSCELSSSWSLEHRVVIMWWAVWTWLPFHSFLALWWWWSDSSIESDCSRENRNSPHRKRAFRAAVKRLLRTWRSLTKSAWSIGIDRSRIDGSWRRLKSMDGVDCVENRIN